MGKYWIINGIGHVIYCNFKTRRVAKEWLERYRFYSLYSTYLQWNILSKNHGFENIH